jgi:tRNA(His) 5'-end guanylyltransferase
MAKKRDALGDRMKKYEYITRTYLVPRMPVIIRLDGKAFHTFTRGFKRPFDEVLISTMQDTTKYLCENIQGCVLGYTQSDEVTLVLVDYKKLNSCAWFDNNIQKMCSIAASMATFAFNRFFVANLNAFYEFNTDIDLTEIGYHITFSEEDDGKYYEAYKKAAEKGAMFDARVFNIPKEEVCNCVLWRQNDATRNSVEMVAQAHFSHGVLQNKSQSQMQDMLMLEKGINWNDFPVHQKRGSCCIKVQGDEDKRPKWIIDKNIPIFKGDGRKYIEDLVFVGEP